MINYYNKSIREFKKYIKKNPYTTRTEWDKYAHENCLFSSFTLESHEITDNTMKILYDNNKDTFEFLKEIFIIVPPKQLKFFKKVVKINRENKRKIGETNDRRF